MRIYRRGKKGTFQMKFQDPVARVERRVSLRVRNRRAAEELARDLAEQVARRLHRLPERKPWDEAVAAYLAHGEIHKSKATNDEDRRTLTKRFHKPTGTRYVDEVRLEHVAAYIGERKAQQRSPFRINRELRTLRAFFNWCIGRRWLPENPAKKVPYLAEPTGVAARCMTSEEIGKLLAAVEGNRLEGIILLALNHGLRESELIHLRREWVNLESGTLWIRHDPQSDWRVKGNEERVIHLNEGTGPWLRRHLAEPARDLSPYLFAMDFGRPWTREALAMTVSRLMRRIGIPHGGLHMLRHTWATLQVERGTPTAVLKDMGGWRDWRSMGKYQHVGSEIQREASGRVVFLPSTTKIVPLERRRKRQ